MLHEIDDTLRQLIYDEGKIDRSQVDISFEQPSSEWSARLGRPTLNLWCYDLRENIRLRNMEMQRPRFDQSKQGRSSVPSSMSLSMPPRRFDVIYLVTAWARRIEDEHQLLWRVLGVLLATPSLDMPGREYEVPLMVAQNVEGTASFTDLWSVLDNQMRLGFNLLMTLELDPQVEREEPLVLDASVRIGQRTEAPERELISPDRVRDNEADDGTMQDYVFRVQARKNGDTDDEDNQ